MTTRTEAVQVIQGWLGNRQDLASDIITSLQLVQTDLEKRRPLPHWLLSEVSFINTVAGEERVPVPVDFLAESEGDALWYFNTNASAPEDVWVELAKDDAQVLRKLYPGSGTPIAYDLTGSYFRIFPTPDDVYQLKQIYFKKGLTLDQDIENEWLANAPNLIMGLAAERVAGGKLQASPLIMQNIAKILAVAETSFVTDVEAREHENREYLMGGVD